uniref:Uncharacterized protein At1g08160-like n=1 Tax=Rhizophora mucronata TaxID=61149 RepID=A0A2P2QSJ7_RHIMU
MEDDSARPATGYPLSNGRHSPPPPPPPAQHAPFGTAYPYGAPPSGTAYPYQAPVFGSAYPQYQAAPTPNQPYYYNRRTLLNRRLFLIFLFSAAIAFSVLFFLWLFLRPHLPEFRVTSLTVSNFNISSQTMSGFWNAKFQVYNPNKKTKISYDAVESEIFYHSETLSRTRISPFFQDPKSMTVLNASYSADTYVDAWVLDGINGDRKHGSVLFDVKLLAKVAYKSRGLWFRRHLLRVFCENMAVGLPANSNSGNFSGGGRACRIH